MNLKRKNIRRVVIGTLIVTLGFSQSGCSAIFGSSPEDVVDEYLDLVRTGDFEELYEYVDDAVDLDKAATTYLDDDMRTVDWSYTVREAFEEEDGRKSVSYSINAYTEEPMTGTFVLKKDGNDWEIRNPLMKASLSDVPFAYTEINGVIAEEGLFWLFPGAYEMYEEENQVADIIEHRVAANPTGIASVDPENSFRYLAQPIEVDHEIKDNLGEAVSEHFASYLGACESIEDPKESDCPVQVEGWHGGSVRISDQRIGSDEIEEISWDFPELPTLSYDHTDWIQASADAEGTATVTVTETNGKVHAIECEFDHLWGFAEATAPDEVGFEGRDMGIEEPELAVNCED